MQAEEWMNIILWRINPPRKGHIKSSYQHRHMSSWADQDTLMEHDQRMFIFQHSSPCCHWHFSIGVAKFESHRSKKLSTANLISSYGFFSQWTFQSMNFLTNELFSPPSLKLKLLCGNELLIFYFFYFNTLFSQHYERKYLSFACQ